MTAQLVTVTGRYVLADDTPAAGTVLLTPVVVAGMSADVKRLVTMHSVMARLDGDGSFEVGVLASDDPDWMVSGPVLYQVAEYIAGARGKGYVVHIPGPGPVDIADLQPVDSPQTVAPYPVPGPPGPQGPPGAPGGAAGTLDDLTDVDTTRDATGMVLTRQSDGTYKGAHVRVSLNQLTDVTAPAATPPNSLLGTVGEGTTAGQAEWEPLHLDYVQQTVLGPLPSTVADLGQRVTELEHTGEIVPPDLELTVDLYSTSFTRIMGCDPITASPSKRIRLTLATTPGPNGTVFADLSSISGTGAVWADFAGNIGKVVDTSGTSINGAALKEAIRRGQIVTVHRGTDGSHPTLVVEKVEDPADAGSSLTLDALKDVDAPANTPAGKVLGTTAVGAWGPVDPPAGGGGGPSPATTNPVSVSVASSLVGTSLDYARADHKHTVQVAVPVALGAAAAAGTSSALSRADHVHPNVVRSTRPNGTDRLIEVWDGTAWITSHYDSGWRQCNDLLHPDLVILEGLLVCRIGWTVYAQIGVSVGTAGWTTGTAMATLPAGFTPGAMDLYLTTPYGQPVGQSVLFQDGRWVLYLGKVDEGYRFNLAWPTTDPLPQSLPGTTLIAAP